MDLADAQSGSHDSAESDTDRTGLLIIRAWMEEGSAVPLRAQIRLTQDVSAGIERTFTVGHVDEVVASVEAWLATISGEANKPQ